MTRVLLIMALFALMVSSTPASIVDRQWTELGERLAEEQTAREEFDREMAALGEAIDARFTPDDDVKLEPVPERVRRLLEL